jgi:hypothetical protein
MRLDRQMGLKKLISPFRDYVNAPKNAMLNRPTVSLKMTVFLDLRPVGW